MFRREYHSESHFVSVAIFKFFLSPDRIVFLPFRRRRPPDSRWDYIIIYFVRNSICNETPPVSHLNLSSRNSHDWFSGPGTGGLWLMKSLGSRRFISIFFFHNPLHGNIQSRQHDWDFIFTSEKRFREHSVLNGPFSNVKPPSTTTSSQTVSQYSQ